MRIVVLASEKSWHYRDLARAAKDLEIELEPFCFTQLSATVGSSNERNSQPQSSLEDADAIIVRTMPSGSLQQIVFRMDAIGKIASRGTPVFNSPKSIEAAIDKYLTLELLSQVGVSVPQTFVSQNVEQAISHFENLNRKAVAKPIFGSMGRGLHLLRDIDEATRYFQACVATGEVIYQQEFIQHAGYDVRLLVLGDEVFAMKRSNPGKWVTNVSQGGKGKPHTASRDEFEVAIQSARAVGAHFAGVDLVYRSSDNASFVLEVNGAPGWKEIGATLQIDVAKKILEEIRTRCQAC